MLVVAPTWVVLLSLSYCTVTSCRSRACRGTHDTTVVTKVGSCLNQYRWKPSLQIYHGRCCRQEAGSLQLRPGVCHGVFGVRGNNISIVGDLTMWQPTVGLQSMCAVSATRRGIWPGCVIPRSRIGGGAALVSPGTAEGTFFHGPAPAV